MLGALLLLVIIVGIVLWHHLMLKLNSKWRHLNKFPGDYPLPFIGNALALGFDADESSHKIMDIWRRLGKTNFRMSVGSEEWVLLSEPDDIGTILNHATELGKSPERNAAMMPFFGNSVSTSEGERWKSTRKLMAPSFHFRTLEQRLDAVNSRCERLVDILGDYVDKGPVDMYRYIRPYMYDIICSALMGVDYNLLKDPDHPYITESSKVINIATQNYFSYWRNIPMLFKLTSSYREMQRTICTIREMSDKIINQRKRTLNKIVNDTQNNNKIINMDSEVLIQNKLAENSCLLDNLMFSKLPNGDTTPKEMVNEEITLLCFTGHYTTTMTISHTLFCIAKYGHVQERIMEEQRSIFRNEMLKKPTIQELNEMKYLEAVIKESIRTIPTVPKIGRQIKQDLALKDGRVIPAGSTVIVLYEGLFLNDNVYPEPEKYNPERFFENMHTFAFAPFSAGPRNCIGFRYAWIAMKATLSNILRRFEVSPCGNGNEPEFVNRIITESKNGIKLNLKTRQI